MKIDIYTPIPEQLYAKILKAINEDSSQHMQLWEVVNDKGIDYITKREVKYYFKVLLEAKIYPKEKLRFEFRFHEYSEPKLSVQCQYMGHFTECLLYNFSSSFKGLQIFSGSLDTV